MQLLSCSMGRDIPDSASAHGEDLCMQRPEVRAATDRGLPRSHLLAKTMRPNTCRQTLIGGPCPGCFAAMQEAGDHAPVRHQHHFVCPSLAIAELLGVRPAQRTPLQLPQEGLVGDQTENAILHTPQCLGKPGGAAPQCGCVLDLGRGSLGSEEAAEVHVRERRLPGQIARILPLVAGQTCAALAQVLVDVDSRMVGEEDRRRLQGALQRRDEDYRRFGQAKVALGEGLELLPEGARLALAGG
mmetsp:Transcript_150801/g.420340  ORF Transcript_150801/g.420340 Transcript_150801/m.420340 type:complete len:243 (+) Transcript_150801:58-786(+)